MACMWRSADSLRELVLSPHHVGPGNWPQFARLGAKRPYPEPSCWPLRTFLWRSMGFSGIFSLWSGSYPLRQPKLQLLDWTGRGGPAAASRPSLMQCWMILGKTHHLDKLLCPWWWKHWSGVKDHWGSFSSDTCIQYLINASKQSACSWGAGRVAAYIVSNSFSLSLQSAI